MAHLMFSEEQTRHIFVEVAGGRGRHGDFLKSFAQAFLRADSDNLRILNWAAVSLIEKYKLAAYLDNFNG
jgi:hypothetical protein